MAFSDLEKYYNTLGRTYFGMLERFKQFDKEHKEGLVKDRQFKRVQKNIEKVRGAYESIAYFFYLWNKPTEEENTKCDEWRKDHEEEFNYLVLRNKDSSIEELKRIIKDIDKYIERVSKDGKE